MQTIYWVRNEAGKVTRIENTSEVAAMAKGEGAPSRLVTIRTNSLKAFASPVATYEPRRVPTDAEFSRSAFLQNCDPQRALNLATAKGDTMSERHWLKVIAEKAAK